MVVLCIDRIPLQNSIDALTQTIATLTALESQLSIETIESQLQAVRKRISDTQVAATIEGEPAISFMDADGTIHFSHEGTEISFDSLPPGIQNPLRSGLEADLEISLPFQDTAVSFDSLPQSVQESIRSQHL